MRRICENSIKGIRRDLYPKGDDCVTLRDFERFLYIQPDQIDFYAPTPRTLLKLSINIENLSYLK